MADLKEEEKTQDSGTSDAKKEGSITLSTPTLEIPDVIDKETDEIAIPDNIPKFIELIAKIPTLPSQILKIVPGELPIEKWMKRFNAMASEATKMVKEYVNKQADLIKKKVGLEKQLTKEGLTNDARKSIEEQIKKVDAELGVIADIMNVYNEIVKYVQEVYNKIKKLVEKVINWVVDKVMEMVNIPPLYRFWIKIFGGILFKFAKGEVPLPGPDPKEIVDWLKENVVDPIKDVATITFKPPLKLLQSMIDSINSVTKHPHSCTWSFTYWADIPPEMLKTEAVQKMIPDKIKPAVNQIIEAAEKADAAYEKAQSAK